MSEKLTFTRHEFPENFTFGVATSSYQIEGHKFGGAGRTHWDDFAETPGNVVRGENGATACDHYHRFEEDFDLVQSGNFDAYRFSTSWARVLPEGEGAINMEGLDYYDRLVDALCARNIKPYLTLYHWELPSPLQDVGGWRNRDTTKHFADYATIIMDRIGDRVHSVAPINEPWCVAWLSHFEGHHAPGLRDIRAAAHAMHHVMLAHGTAIEAMRAQGYNNIGGVFNMEYPMPADARTDSNEVTHIYDSIYNRWFLDAARKQQYPEMALKGLAPHMPKGWQDDMPTIGAPLDWIGINYYTRKLLRPNNSGLFPGYEPADGPLDKTSMGWEIYPDGLYNFIKRVNDEYAHSLPIYITENGMSADDTLIDGACQDLQRISYLNQHMDAVKRAISEGANVHGYFIWSLLDNYEWALGYEKRFGLIHVDFASLHRTPKASFNALKQALVR